MEEVRYLVRPHLTTLFVKEKLTMLTLQMEEQLFSALPTMEEMLACHLEKLGKECLYTILQWSIW